MDNKQKLQEGLTALGLTLTTAQQLLLLEYIALLKKWNGTYNLTALRDEQTMISHHILDSLTLLPYIEQASTLMDVGRCRASTARGGVAVSIIRSSDRGPCSAGYVLVGLFLVTVTPESSRSARRVRAAGASRAATPVRPRRGPGHCAGSPSATAPSGHRT